MDIFELLNPVAENLFFRKNDKNDVRLGEIVAEANYEEAEIVIVGCPQDEGVRRNGGRTGAALAPDKIREQFYKLTPFGISAKIFDCGNTKIADTLEQTHETQTKIIAQILRDDKKIISLGGGNDVSFADGCAMAEVFGRDEWLGFNIDAHFDVRADETRNSGTPYRQLLEEGFVTANNFYEMCYQPQVNSPIYFEYLREKGVNSFSLEEAEARDAINLFTDILEKRHLKNIFWGFDVDAVCAADAPGVSASNPLGISGKDFCQLAKLAGSRKETKIIEFTEVNPNFDVDNRTTKLTATAIHECCCAMKKAG